MKQKCLCLLFFLTSLSANAQFFLPQYQGHREFVIELGYRKHVKSNITRKKVVNELEINLVGDQIYDVRSQTVILPYDIVFKYKGNEFFFPFKKITNTRVLGHFDLITFPGFKDKWIFSIIVADSGPKGPIYGVRKWFLIQYVDNRLISSYSIMDVSEEDGPKISDLSIDVENIGTGGGIAFYNIGNSSFLLEEGIFVEDYRFMKRSYHFTAHMGARVWDSLNFRDKPGRDGKVLFTLKPGTFVRVLKYAGKVEEIDNMINPWIKIGIHKDSFSLLSEDYMEGYVWGGYLK